MKEPLIFGYSGHGNGENALAEILGCIRWESAFSQKYIPVLCWPGGTQSLIEHTDHSSMLAIQKAVRKGVPWMIQFVASSRSLTAMPSDWSAMSMMSASKREFDHDRGAAIFAWGTREMWTLGLAANSAIFDSVKAKRDLAFHEQWPAFQDNAWAAIYYDAECRKDSLSVLAGDYLSGSTGKIVVIAHRESLERWSNGPLEQPLCTLSPSLSSRWLDNPYTAGAVPALCNSLELCTVILEDCMWSQDRFVIFVNADDFSGPCDDLIVLSTLPFYQLRRKVTGWHKRRLITNLSLGGAGLLCSFGEDAELRQNMMSRQRSSMAACI